MTEIAKSESTISVAVIDDDANIRDGLWWLLSNIVGIDCLGAYPSVKSARRELANKTPDILLLDIDFPRESGIEAIDPLLTQFPETKIIMHSNYDEEDKIVDSMRAGASGYVLKNAAAPTLHDAILRVHSGETVWPHGYSDKDGGGRPSAGRFKERILAFFKALGSSVAIRRLA